MASHVTVKGGVVMQQVSGDVRRATRDVDLDFVRYPMTVEGIRAFLHALCQSGSGVALEMVGPIVDLKHQDYHGKRVNLRISDCNGMPWKQSSILAFTILSRLSRRNCSSILPYVKLA